MNRRVLLTMAAGGLVLLAFGSIWLVQRDPTGAASGTRDASKVLWQRLAAYQDSYLGAWRDAFQESEPDPTDVLDAWSEVASKVTGPTGFWRETVPNQWFGCPDDPGAPMCRKLGQLGPELSAWDTLQEEIGALEPGRERAFLAKNADRMLRYLDTYVPSAPSDTGMRDTAFFRENLQVEIAGNR